MFYRGRTSRLWHRHQRYYIHGYEKWRTLIADGDAVNSGLFGLPRHSYVAATAQDKQFLLAYVIRNSV